MPTPAGAWICDNCGHQVSGDKNRCDECRNLRPAPTHEISDEGDEVLELAQPARQVTPEPPAPAEAEAPPPPEVVIMHAPSPLTRVKDALGHVVEAFLAMPLKKRLLLAGGAVGAVAIPVTAYLLLRLPGVECVAGTKMERAPREDGGGMALCRSEKTGWREGPAVLYDDQRRIVARTYFSRDKLEGKYESYYPSGKIHEQGNYQENQKSSFWNTFAEDGRKLTMEVMQGGKRHGVSETYYPDGKVQLHQLYSYDKLEGTSVSYFANGQKEEEGAYAKNEKNGTWTRYNEAGLLLEETEWDHGQQVNRHDMTGAAAATADAADTTSDAPPAPGIPVDLENRLFAGRPLDWWKERIISMKLRALANPANQAAYELTLQRARLNGLFVEQTPDGTQVRLATANDPPPTAATPAATPPAANAEKTSP